jgi:hypothetical protein
VLEPVPELLELVAAVLLPLAPAVLELLLQAAAPITTAAARKAGAPRRSARPAPLPCLVEIISRLADGAGGLAACAVGFVRSCSVLTLNSQLI